MRFVLIHGGFHGAWCWNRTAAELEKLGHEAIAIDLPGHGIRKDERSTLADRRDAIVAVMNPADVLVGHSGGGYDITLAADAAPDLVKHMVYLAAGLPLEGRSVLDATGGAATKHDDGTVEVQQLKSDETGMSRLVRRTDRGRMECFDFEAAREYFYHDCDAETARWAFSMLTPAPVEFLVETVSIPRFWAANIPRSYVLCLQDRAKSRAASEVVVERLGVDPLTIEGSHSPFLSRPGELARAPGAGHDDFTDRAIAAGLTLHSTAGHQEENMKRSTERILTTHCGSLPRTPEVLAMLREAAQGEAPDRAKFDAVVRDGVEQVVGSQIEAGVDVVNDGEMSKHSFMSYYAERLGGFTMMELEAPAEMPVRGPSAEEADYPEFFERWAFRGSRPITEHEGVRRIMTPVATSPITYAGTSALERDIDNLLVAAKPAGPADVFLSAAPPVGLGLGFGATGDNQYYATQDEFEEAICEAMRVEYEAIVEAGIVLQFDCNWAALGRHLGNSADDLRRMIAHGIERLNYAARNIDPDKMRIHLCWGADEAPHHKDLPLQAIVDLMMTARPAGLGVVAANGRHEWEWRVWKDVEVPDGKVIIPGVIDSTTNIIEHPETVAERIRRFADVLGKDNIIAGVDCGLDTVAGSAQVVPRIAWAKLAALSEGARLATESLY